MISWLRSPQFWARTPASVWLPEASQSPLEVVDGAEAATCVDRGLGSAAGGASVPGVALIVGTPAPAPGTPVEPTLAGDNPVGPVELAEGAGTAGFDAGAG
jgi:hypothetical protein